MDTRPTYHAYTDGSAIGNPGDAAWAIAIVDDKGRLVTAGDDFLVRQTNNFAELFAIVMAAESCPHGAHLVIHSDSKIALHWLSRHRKEHDEIARLLEWFDHIVRSNDLVVTLDKVKGHAGIEWNEFVDACARTKARELASYPN